MQTREDNGTFTIVLGRRIDSNNAAETEKELFSLTESRKDSPTVEIDAAALEYISSAGLRILMKLRVRLRNLLRSIKRERT